ncbi:uncharacterized protein TNCV_4083351 [Trichonephila clavipes]|nr:uncharacterized protein TNCV_4083351 [Trichonephila clavipes]
MEQPSFNDTNSHNLRNIADTSDEVIRGLKSIDTKAESRDNWETKTRSNFSLISNERKFKNNPDFEKQYKEFMNEYESLGHMSLVNSRSHTSKDQNFLPHHAVIKPSSLTTKLRVVFDASCKTTNVADEDQRYQQILWRNNSSENIRTYKLKTVTYGLASASFLATRCIKQIALDDKDNPNLSRVLQEDIYMDDLLSGADTPNNAIPFARTLLMF